MILYAAVAAGIGYVLFGSFERVCRMLGYRAHAFDLLPCFALLVMLIVAR